LKPFEMLVMIKPGLSDEDLASCRGRLEGWLAEYGGKVDEVVDWGEMALAYPVKKNSRGRFLLFWFDGPGELPQSMAQRIRIDEEILRHLLIHRDPAAIKTVKRASEDRNDGKRSQQDRPDGKSHR
jgi:small subunit ribosomal protein S6